MYDKNNTQRYFIGKYPKVNNFIATQTQDEKKPPERIDWLRSSATFCVATATLGVARCDCLELGGLGGKILRTRKTRMKKTLK